MGYYLDGRVNVVFGTHTHVPTSDMQILPGGSAYVTDLGMCGESGGILGMDKDRVILRMRSHLPHPFKVASGPLVADGVIFELDTKSGKVTSTKSVKIT